MLAPHWISPRRRPEGCWSLTERPGRLTLTATGDSLDRPGCTFVGRRQQHHDCRAAASLEPGEAARAGLSVRLDEAHHYDLEVSGGTAAVIARIGPLRQRVAEHAVPAGPVALAVEIRATRDPGTQHGPDTLAFSVGTAGGTVRLAELDGRYLSTEVAAGFTGRVIGMYVTEGRAAFDWFEYAPATP